MLHLKFGINQPQQNLSWKHIFQFHLSVSDLEIGQDHWKSETGIDEKVFPSMELSSFKAWMIPLKHCLTKMQQ